MVSLICFVTFCGTDTLTGKPAFLKAKFTAYIAMFVS